MGLFDASETSADHTAWVETWTPLRIEAVHRPATLLYGPSAIGGAVVGMCGAS
jgi:outer membrane receptor for ferrienterochelin and colicin